MTRMTKAQYADYLRTPGWKAKRKAALWRGGDHCALCASRSGLDVHHNSYERVWVEWQKEVASDLVVLCRNCHSLYHGHLPVLQEEPEEAMENDNVESSIGTRIRDMRLKRGLGKDEAAEGVGCSVSWLAKVESGHLKDVGASSRRNQEDLLLTLDTWTFFVNEKPTPQLPPQWVRIYRKHLGMTQIDLATVAGISRSAVSRFENETLATDHREWGAIQKAVCGALQEEWIGQRSAEEPAPAPAITELDPVVEEEEDALLVLTNKVNEIAAQTAITYGMLAGMKLKLDEVWERPVTNTSHDHFWKRS